MNVSFHMGTHVMCVCSMPADVWVCGCKCNARVCVHLFVHVWNQLPLLLTYMYVCTCTVCHVHICVCTVCV